MYHSETWELMDRRWSKLIKDFRKSNEIFDISKIPDIYDNIKYDQLHNQPVLEFEHAKTLHDYSKAMADIVIPQVKHESVAYFHYFMSNFVYINLCSSIF